MTDIGRHYPGDEMANVVGCDTICLLCGQLIEEPSTASQPHECDPLLRKWAERDAHYAAQAEKHRQERIAIVRKALIEKCGTEIGWARRYAEVAIDALVADGVVFARMGTWDDEQPEPTGDREHRG